MFEFLTNQSVADMVSRYEDPLDACKKVVQEAYDLWLQYEVRTDDITIICLYIGEFVFSSSPRGRRGGRYFVCVVLVCVCVSIFRTASYSLCIHVGW